MFQYNIQMLKSPECSLNNSVCVNWLAFKCVVDPKGLSNGSAYLLTLVSPYVLQQ